MHRRIRAVLASLAAATAVFATPATASAAVPAPQMVSTIGHDASHPQCDGTGTLILPPGQAFAVVGVNGGVANTTNPCLDSELAWASASTGVTPQAPVSVYVNTANPGLAASWWPTAGRTALGTDVLSGQGTCRHRAGPDCAYVYGYSLAEQDLRRPSVALPPGTIWYLDVEEANTWSDSTAANRTVLEGMAAAFTDSGFRTGLYANRSDWNRFIGRVPPSSSLYRLPTWLAGAVTPARRGGELQPRAAQRGWTHHAHPVPPGGVRVRLRSLLRRPAGRAPALRHRNGPGGRPAHRDPGPPERRRPGLSVAAERFRRPRGHLPLLPGRRRGPRDRHQRPRDAHPSRLLPGGPDQRGPAHRPVGRRP